MSPQLKSFDAPISQDSSPVQPLQADEPSPQVSPSLPGARDFHRQQAARLTALLRNAVPDLQDPLGHEDPKEALAQAEEKAKQAIQDLAVAQGNVVRKEILELMAKLDLLALKDLLAHLKK